MAELPLTKHLRLSDFVTHDNQEKWPRYAALDGRLLDKIELVIAEIARLSGKSEDSVMTLDVHSGYRTPLYNRRVTRAARDSRHQYGDAADVALDANGDGELDVAASSYATATLSVAAGRGDGSFLPAASYPIPGPGTADTATADFNADGSPDLAVCGSANLLSIFTNTGGAFGQRSDYPSASSCTSMAVADFDGDGRPDLALNHFAGSGTLSIFRNTTMPPDAQPPAISIAASPRILWPAHGGTIAVTLSGTITDEGSGVDASSLAFSVEDEYGLVEPAGRLTADTAGRYSFSVPLTASRRGDDTDGRTYRIVVTAADRAGNRTSAAAIVMVPHDRGR
jgi:hypothetical protein